MGANELGEIPVLMYHRVLEDAVGDYDITPDEFRAELHLLHEQGYVPITTAELVSGRIDVPAGTTPVVLTFDDSTREQFALDEDGEVDPDTAVGILLETAEELDGFVAAGSFYVLSSLFGAPEDRGRELLAELADLGFEIGNHTAEHTPLGQRTNDGDVARAIADGVDAILAAVPDADVRTLSYPLGSVPEDTDVVAAGSHGGTEYRNDAALLVGAEPAPSPHHVDFDPLAIPRIRSQPTWDGDADFGSGFWLDVLETSPERRYVSDGDPDTIAFPEGLADQLAPDDTERAVAY